MGLLFVYADINFLHFAVLLFVVCTAVLVVTSVLTEPPATRQLAGLTLATRAGSGQVDSSRGRDLGLTLALVVCVLALWLYFS